MKKQIDVLLATYNGERYLAQFLDSLLSQESVSINLIASDDGSTDSTIQILNNYAEKFTTFHIYKGTGTGPSRNFMALLPKGSSSFFAFADQDDIWHKKHLINSLKRLEEHDTDFTFGPVQLFENNHNLGIWPRKGINSKLSAFLFENQIRGCTIVANARAREFFLRHHPKNAIMHDWWFGLIAVSCLNIDFSITPEIQYRIHEGNHTNSRRNLLQKISEYEGITKNWKPILQLEELFHVYGNFMKESHRKEIKETLESFSSNKLKSRFFFLQPSKRFRHFWIENFALKIILFARLRKPPIVDLDRKYLDRS
jgi:glycosyltransferase involved in cell wall biosynthesis